MVEPTNLKPRFLRSLLMRSERRGRRHVGLGFQRFTIGSPSTISPI